MNFNEYFLYLFIYSVLGWICEVIYCRIVHGNWTNRGFLSGPYCPIYGFGGLFIILLLSPFISNPILIFLLSILVTTTLEYITSFLMEKIFNAKWWDYSNEFLNINGRVCLATAIPFGILGVLVMYFIHPFTTKLIALIPNWIINYIVGGLISLTLLDIVTTISTLFNLKDKLKEAKLLAEKISENGKDMAKNSEVIKQLEEVKNSIIEKTNIFHNRIIKAFPNLEFNKYAIQFSEIKAKVLNKKNIKIKKEKENKNKNKNRTENENKNVNVKESKIKNETKEKKE